MPPDRTPASTQRYGRACANCSQSKSKCSMRPGGQGCERCYRLKKLCLPGNSTRAQRNNPTARIASLEEKLDGLVSLLTSGSLVLNNDSHPAGQDHLTPPFSISNASSALSAPVEAATSDDPSGLSQEECLTKFRTHMLKYFAFLHLPGDAESLRRERPFLFLCIIAVSSQSTQRKLELGEEIKQTLTDRIFLDNDSTAINIDLLLGLLTFLAWGHDHLLHGTAAKVSRFTQLAMMLVYDLRLNKPLPDDPNMLPVGGNCLVPRGPTRSLEERRAVLGCFVMSSIVSSYFAQIDVIQWTPYMEECLDVLSQHAESPYDEMFTHQVRLQRIVVEVESTRGSPAAPPAFYLTSLQSRVNDIKAQISPQLQQEEVLLASVYYAELGIFGLALSKQNTSCPGFQKVDYLYICLSTVKLAFENFFKIPSDEYHGISFPLFTQLARYLIVLSKLSTLNDPAWDTNLAKSTVDVLQVIDQLINNIQHAKAADGEESVGGLLDKSTGIFTSVRSWCAARLMEGNGVEGGDSYNADCQLDDHHDTQLETLLLEDSWWRDSFDVFLEGM